MKQTFEIPQGCTRVTIEQHDNQIITTFEPEVKFKDGDIVYCKDKIYEYIFIFKALNDSTFNPFKFHVSFGINDDSDDALQYNGNCRGSEDIIRLSPESLPIIQDALAKVGKVWNAEKKCIEELKPKRWRAKHGGNYWAIDSVFDAFQTKDDYSKWDNDRFEFGNYFQTEQQSKDFAERIKQLPR